MSAVSFPRKVNVEKLNLTGEVKEMKGKGLTIIPFDYNGEKSIVIQTPKMKVPFGISEGMENSGTFHVELSFDGESGDSKEAKRMRELRTCIEKLNTKLVETCHGHPEWFKGKIKKGKDQDYYEEELFANSIKSPKEEYKDKYSDRFKIKIPTKDGIVSDYVGFYTDKKKKLTWEEVSAMKGFSAMCLFKITGAWVSPSLKKFGYFIKLVQMQVFPGESIREFSIQKYDSDSDSDDSGNESESDLDENIESDDAVCDLE